MRKIKSKSEIERIEKKRQKILTGVLGFILLASTLGYSFLYSDGNDSVSADNIEYYNDVAFTRGISYWEVDSGKNTFYFNYLPSDLTNYNVTLNKTMDDYSGQTLYYSGDVNTRFLSNINSYVTRIQESKLSNSDSKDVPVKNCSLDNVIVFKQSSNSSIYMNENCVILSGDLSKMSDLLFYKLLEIL
jgi:hypothetical protein